MKAMRQNDRWRWLTAGAVAVALLAFTLLIALLARQGMRAFWPQHVDLYTLTQPDGQTTALLGETLEHKSRFPAPAGDSALTLTLPVVIVATEEGLSRIPDSLRQGSLALGATQAETLWRMELPVDAVFPWLHLDRKFMHLGFQIYDLAFQSPNVEADRPLVYATALLVVIILSLNLLAMALSHRLRERYRLMTQ
nr:hypothetical protein [Candidatus Pantoea persica]MBA2817163.1 phosphate ABC transporter, permease protein PstA [Candidatus Pantoea persica]